MMLMKMLSLSFTQREELKNYKELVKTKGDDLTSFYDITIYVEKYKVNFITSNLNVHQGT